MTDPLRTCTHTNDTGRICNSVAARNQKYCPFHLRYRARQLRLAQVRARAERFDIKLPPLEDMHAVQSALSQLAEALAADMIDLKRAHALMSVLRLMSLNFRHPEKWQTNLYHSDQATEVNIAQEFGLPRDLDLDTPPEVAFPSDMGDGGAPPLSPDFGDRVGATASADGVEGPPFDLSSRAERSGVEGPAFSDNRPLTTDNLDFRPDFPVSPEFLELRDISRVQGSDAATLRFRELERNRARRELRSDRKRYADIALRLNLKKAAERLAEKKVAEKLAEAGIAPAPANAEPIDYDREFAEGMRKSAAAFAEIDACLAAKEVKIA